MPAHSYMHRGDHDTARMRGLLVAMRGGGRHTCWHVGDLVWRLFLQSLGHDVSRTVRLWDEPAGCLAGFAVLAPSRSGRPAAGFEIQIHYDLRGRGLEDEMLDWLEAEFRRTVGAGRLIADPGAYDDDTAQILALERRGYRRLDDGGLLLIRPLDEPLPAPALPPGFCLRAVAGPDEIPARAAAHRDAFSPSRVTDEGYRRLAGTPGYDRELDVVAVAPDGAMMAAFALGWLDAANRVGEFEPVGTREAFRRMGLAAAVLREGMRQMQARGAAHALVGPVEVADEAAVRLYAGVGFRAMHRVVGYGREIA